MKFTYGDSGEYFYTIEETDVSFLHDAYIFDKEGDLLVIINSGTRGRAVDAAQKYIQKLEDKPKEAVFSWLSSR